MRNCGGNCGGRCNICKANNNCGCDRDNPCNHMDKFQKEVDEITDGISDSRDGVADIIKCKDGEGIRQCREGICQIEEGVSILRENLRCIDECRNCEALREIREGICDIEEGIRDMEEGLCDVTGCRRRDSIRQIREGTCDVEEGLVSIIEAIGRLVFEEECECGCCCIKDIRIDISINNRRNCN